MNSVLPEPSQGDLQAFKKRVNLQALLNKLAPGVPPYNRKRSHNPVAYHKYTLVNECTFYIMEYIILEDNFIRFWGYECNAGGATLDCWYRTLGMMMLIETHMKRDPDFKPAHATDIPEIGRLWLSKQHDRKRDILGANYLRKLIKAEVYGQTSLENDIKELYQIKAEELDEYYLKSLNLAPDKL